MSDPCFVDKCDRPARVGIRTTQGGKSLTHGIKVTIYTDDRDAPTTALRYCKGHGMELAASVIKYVSDRDEDTHAKSASTR